MCESKNMRLAQQKYPDQIDNVVTYLIQQGVETRFVIYHYIVTYLKQPGREIKFVIYHYFVTYLE